MGDTALAAALFAALIYRPEFQARGFIGGQHKVGLLAAVVVIAWPLLMTRCRVYSSQRRDSTEVRLGRLLLANGLGGVILSFVTFAAGAPVSPTLPLVFASTLFAILALMRVSAFSILHAARRSGHNFRNILIVGSGPRAVSASETVARHPEWGLRIIGFVDDGELGFAPAVEPEHVHKFVDLPGLLRDQPVDEVLVACPSGMLGALVPVVQECALVGVPVTLLTDLFVDELPPPRVGQFGSLATLSFAPVHHNEIELAIKRGIDVAGSLVGLMISAPFLALAAIAIRATSPGPVVFVQHRRGLNGRLFPIYKLRTMYQDAEARKAELMELNEMDGPVFKIRSDPRITPVGRLLRRYSIDELPQFWNVLRGDMSLVGPRPPTPDEVLQYVGSERRRLSMRPGLTCLWQVSGRNSIAFEEWMKLDLEYIDGWSLWLDCKILLMTVPEVLFARGE